MKTKKLSKFQDLTSRVQQAIIELGYKLQILSNRQKRTVHLGANGLVSSIDGLSGKDEQAAVESLNQEIKDELRSGQNFADNYTGSVAYLYDKPVSQMNEWELDVWYEMCQSNQD